MDKITRILLLYSRLINGEKVNKNAFCLETDCQPRSFDRDIEDIRWYFNEVLENNKLLYNRSENIYYLKESCRTELEIMEYELIERLLLDTGVLRQDEMSELLEHLKSNTEKRNGFYNIKTKFPKEYREPLHKKALIKMYGDLSVIIGNQSVIKIKYMKVDGSEVEREVLPCLVKYDMGYLYLVAYLLKENSDYPAYFRLDRIDSFKILRSQMNEEKQRVKRYLQKYSQGITQMYGGEFLEIEVICEENFYSYVHDKFREAVIVGQEEEKVRVKLCAFDQGFIKWIISQPASKIYVDKPTILKKKIAKEAKKIWDRYEEV